jgi:hypothetical protein
VDNISFNKEPEISSTYGFEITAFPPSRPKYESLERRFRHGDLSLTETRFGEYNLEGRSSLEAKLILNPSAWDERNKKCEVTITCTGLSYKYDDRKGIVDFGNYISSLISWKHKIMWFTENNPIIVWKNDDDKKTKVEEKLSHEG